MQLIETQEVGEPTNAPKDDIEVRKAALFVTQTIGNIRVNAQTSRKSKLLKIKKASKQVVLGLMIYLEFSMSTYDCDSNKDNECTFLWTAGSVVIGVPTFV